MNYDASKCAECGLHVIDPLHIGFHSITLWNKQAYKIAREKSEKEFEKRLGPQKKEEKWKPSQSLLA